MHRTSRSSTTVVAIALVFHAHAGIAAQTPSDSGRTAQLPTIVVTATKVAVPAVTSATTVLLGDDLRRQGITNLADALRSVPGLAVVATSSPGARTSVYLRGGESGYTRVLVDGVAVNDPGGEFDYAHMTTDDVDRIEIIRGPSSVLYGTDAVTGVIQVFTRQGEGPMRARIDLEAGSFGTRAVHANVSGGTSAAGYSLGIGRRETDGIHAFNSAYGRTVLNGAVRVGSPGGGDARATLQYSDTDVHVPTDGGGALVDRNAFQFGERYTLGIEAGRPLSDRLDIRLLLASHTTDGGFDDAADGPDDTSGFFSSIGLDHVSRRSADLRANARIGSAVLTGGALVENQRQRGFADYDSEFGPSHSEINVERTTRAGYLQFVGTAAALAWNMSVRIDDNDAFGTFGTWRAGLRLSPFPSTTLRAVAGRAFREPTFFQNFATGFVVGNPDLRPEAATSWEVGLDQRVAKDRVTLHATWFDQRFTDLIEYSFVSDPGEPNYFNIAGARARGLEAEIRGQVAEGVSAGANYTWLDAFITDAGFDQSGTGFFVNGAPLLRRPAHTAAGFLTLRARSGNQLAVRATRHGAREDVDYAAGGRALLPAYTVVDVSGNVRVLRRGAGRPGMLVTARISNLLDEDYQAVLGFATPGRGVTLGVTFD